MYTYNWNNFNCNKDSTNLLWLFCLKGVIFFVYILYIYIYTLIAFEPDLPKA